MPIHARTEELQVHLLVCQARYSDGFRLLDRAGELLNTLKKQFPLWTIRSTDQSSQTYVLRNDASQIQLNIGTESVDLRYTGSPLKLADAEKKNNELADAAEPFYHLVIETLGCETTFRVGAEYHFFAPADTLEDSDRLMCRAVQSPLVEAVLRVTNGALTDAVGHLVLEDAETGLRRAVRLMSLITKQAPGSPPFAGYPLEGAAGGILADIDTYHRPPQGHYPKFGFFVRDAFLRARGISTDLLRWMITGK
jgi:hypothetical protein